MGLSQGGQFWATLEDPVVSLAVVLGIFNLLDLAFQPHDPLAHVAHEQLYVVPVVL
ncbi:hypothetical protein D3C72_1371890 [compost metagenome]